MIAASVRPRSALVYSRFLSRPLRTLSTWANALVYPRSVDDYLQLVNPLWSSTEIRARVVKVTQETADVVSLALAANWNFRGYRAGQYVAVSVDIAGVRHTRCFSLSSSPLQDDNLVTITVKAHTGGVVSTYLVENAQPGLVLTLSEPQGEFVLPQALPSRVLLISGGSGITPCMSILRTLLRGSYMGEISFLHFARSDADVIFSAELRELAARHSHLKLTVCAGPTVRQSPVERWILTEPILEALVPNFHAVDTWVCGPARMLDAVKRIYCARGALARLRVELFTGSSPVASDEQPAAVGGNVEFVRAGRSILAQSVRNLLEQAEAVGLNPNSGCRMGICQTCKCRKLRGVTRDLRTGELSPHANVDIQLCVSAPVGDVALDL